MNNTTSNQFVIRAITRALLELLNTKKLDKISITELTKRAKVGRMSFYRNFENKEAVLRRYLTGVTDNFIQESQLNFHDSDIKAYILALFKHLEHYKDFAENLYQSDCLYLVEEQFYRAFMQKEYGYNKYEIAFYIGGIYNVYYTWLQNHFRETPEELAEQLGHLFRK